MGSEGDGMRVGDWQVLSRERSRPLVAVSPLPPANRSRLRGQRTWDLAHIGRSPAETPGRSVSPVRRSRGKEVGAVCRGPPAKSASVRYAAADRICTMPSLRRRLTSPSDRSRAVSLRLTDRLGLRSRNVHAQSCTHRWPRCLQHDTALALCHSSAPAPALHRPLKPRRIRQHARPPDPPLPPSGQRHLALARPASIRVLQSIRPPETPPGLVLFAFLPRHLR